MHQPQVGIGKGEYALNIVPPVSRSCLPDVDIIHEVEVVILSFPENWRLKLSRAFSLPAFRPARNTILTSQYSEVTILEAHCSYAPQASKNTFERLSRLMSMTGERKYLRDG